MMTRLSAYALLLSVLATTHAFAPHRRAHASLLRAATADLDALSYRELQAACKAAKLPAKGAAAVLRERLRDAAPEDAAPMAVDVAVAAGAAVDVDAAVAADDDDAVFAALLGDADAGVAAAAPDDDDEDFFAALLAGGDDEDYVAAALATAADAAVDGVADARRALSAEARSGSASRIRAAWARFAAACDGSDEAPSEGDACLALRPYSASGACDEARTVLEDVERLGRNGTAREWHLALEAFSRAKRPVDADRFLGAARLRGAFPARPDGRLYRQVLKHCVGAANWRRALHVLEDMEAQKVDDEDLSVDARDWNLGVFAAERLAVDGAKRAATKRGSKRAVKEGDAAAPGRILAAMAAHGHAPELKALGAAVNAARHAARPDLALARLSELRAAAAGSTPAPWEPDYRADGVVAALDAVKRAAAALDGDARASEATRDSYAAAAVAVLEQFARDDDGGEDPALMGDDRKRAVAAELAALLEPGEKVAGGVRRLGRALKAKGAGAAEAFEQLSGLADALVSAGRAAVYDETREDLERFAAPPRALAPAGDDRAWEYRATDGAVYGPYDTQTILDWRSGGFFTGDSAVPMREVARAPAPKPAAAADDLAADLEDSDDDDAPPPENPNRWVHSDDIDFLGDGVESPLP